jgi:hypothetical protein
MPAGRTAALRLRAYSLVLLVFGSGWGLAVENGEINVREGSGSQFMNLSSAKLPAI